jgi:hypothetical protein
VRRAARMQLEISFHWLVDTNHAGVSVLFCVSFSLPLCILRSSPLAPTHSRSMDTTPVVRYVQGTYARQKPIALTIVAKFQLRNVQLYFAVARGA